MAAEALKMANETKIVVSQLEIRVKDSLVREKEDRRDAKRERELIQSQLNENSKFITATLTPLMGQFSDMLKAMNENLRQQKTASGFQWRDAAIIAGVGLMFFLQQFMKTGAA